MTDGSLICFDDGNLLRIFNAKDSMGLRLAQLNGIVVGVITGGRSKSITARFLTCGVKEEDVYLGSCNKMTDFKSFCEKYGFSADEVLYVGDDIPDVPVIKAAGIGVAPSDSVAEALAAADYVSPFKGGKGCIREVCEHVLKAQGKWQFDVDRYEDRYKTHGNQ